MAERFPTAILEHREIKMGRTIERRSLPLLRKETSS
jgi:hypothetical protein